MAQEGFPDSGESEKATPEQRKPFREALYQLAQRGEAGVDVQSGLRLWDLAADISPNRLADIPRSMQKRMPPPAGTVRTPAPVTYALSVTCYDTASAEALPEQAWPECLELTRSVRVGVRHVHTTVSYELGESTPENPSGIRCEARVHNTSDGLAVAMRAHVKLAEDEEEQEPTPEPAGAFLTPAERALEDELTGLSRAEAADLIDFTRLCALGREGPLTIT